MAYQPVLILKQNFLTYRQAPTHWLKFYEKAVIESEARTAVMQLKSEA